MDDILTVQNLDLTILQAEHKIPLLKNINLTLKKGHVHALVGESGSGKSMTANALLQLLPANIRFSSRSVVKLVDQNLLNYSEVKMRDVRGVKISMVFQEPMSALNPVMTIGQQIAEVLTTHQLRATKLEVKSTVNEILKSVGLTDHDYSHYYPHQLSGGMRQRAVIAIAIAASPDIIIADEPTTALDSIMQAQILTLLIKLTKEKQVALLLITHDMNLVSRYADSVSLIYYGEILEENTAQCFTKTPLHPYGKQLFETIPNFEKREQNLSVIEGSIPTLGTSFQGCIFTPRCQFAMDICHQSKPQWYQVNSGKVLCHLYDQSISIPVNKIKHKPLSATRQNARSNKTLLTIHHATKTFKQNIQGKKQTITALDSVSFSIKQNECFALVGGSGSGKSTIASAIAGLCTLDQGDILFNDKQLVHMPRKEKASLIQLIFQDPYNSLNPKLTIEESLKEALQFQKNAKNNHKEVLIDMLEQVGLHSDVLGRFPHEFSGGQRQRIAIARAIAARPQLLICDEPTSALDISVQAQTLNLLKKLQQQYQLTLLLITHNISVVAYMADTVAVMHQGKILESGNTQQILFSPKHDYTKQLINS